MKELYSIPFKNASNYEELFASSIELNEQSREKLALELHEEIASDLVALQMKVQTIEIKKSDKSQISSGLKNIITRIRKISNTLFPLSLEELGLTTALKIRLKDMQDHTNTKVELTVAESYKSFREQHIESVIYFCVDEILNFFTHHCVIENLIIELEISNQIIFKIKDEVLSSLHLLSSGALAFKVECMSVRLKKIDSIITIGDCPDLYTQIKIDFRNAK
ncbi:MAG: signal transduction histidine kinase [Arenicella sp.]|jgi:signal transduction histidine kinase